MTQSSMFDERGADLLAILMSPVPEAPKPAPFVTRHYYRCCDCLSVAATVAKIAGAVCDACGGAIEYMGASWPQTDNRFALVRRTRARRDVLIETPCGASAGDRLPAPMR